MSSLNAPFVPVLEEVLTSTQDVTLRATENLKGKGIDTEVEKFEADVKEKIAETRARLNQVKNVPGTAPGQGAPPVQGALPAPGQELLLGLLLRLLLPLILFPSVIRHPIS